MTTPKDYNWADVANDLALSTHLTLTDARDWVRGLEQVPGLIPYDVLYWLVELQQEGHQRRAAALRALLLRAEAPRKD